MIKNITSRSSHRSLGMRKEFKRDIRELKAARTSLDQL